MRIPACIAFRQFTDFLMLLSFFSSHMVLSLLFGNDETVDA
jgi:hypothetical protein